VTVREDIRTLVVDDIATNLKVASRFVAKYGVAVDTALSGEEALEKAAENDYDLIFMDHMMPGMDGVEAAAKIRALPGGRYADRPIVALTANAVTGMKEFFLKNGFSDYLPKPIELAKLNVVMERWCSPDHPDALPAEPAEPVGLSIPGVNVEAAIKLLCGSEDIYREVLEAFCQDVTERLPMLSHVPDAQTLSLFIVMAHAIKGAAANICAHEIARSAERLEKAGKAGDLSAIRQEIPGFVADLSDLTANIERALSQKA
jgi:CheY-like chemotaxis protein